MSDEPQNPSQREITVGLESKISFGSGIELEAADVLGNLLRALSQQSGPAGETSSDITNVDGVPSKITLNANLSRRILKKEEEDRSVAVVAEALSNRDGCRHWAEPRPVDDGEEDGFILNEAKQRIGVQVTQFDAKSKSELRHGHLDRETDVDSLVEGALEAIQAKQLFDQTAAGRMLLVLVAPYVAPRHLQDRIVEQLLDAAPPNIYLETWLVWPDSGARQLIR